MLKPTTSPILPSAIRQGKHPPSKTCCCLHVSFTLSTRNPLLATFLLSRRPRSGHGSAMQPTDRPSLIPFGSIASLRYTTNGLPEYLSGWSSRHAPPIPLESLWSGTECRLSEYADPPRAQALNGGPRQNHVGIFRVPQETKAAYRMAGNGRGWYSLAWPSAV
jgi:hypothetical protein